MSVSERIAGRTLPLVGIGRSKLTLGDLVQYLCGLSVIATTIFRLQFVFKLVEN